MTKHEFVFDGETLTSIVMSEEEFDELLDFLKFLFMTKAPMNMRTNTRFTEKDLANLRSAKHVPMVARGTVTEPIFQKYEVTSGKMSFIVRGQGPDVFARYFSDGDVN
jgi:hypothetical protein